MENGNSFQESKIIIIQVLRYNLIQIKLATEVNKQYCKLMSIFNQKMKITQYPK